MKFSPDIVQTSMATPLGDMVLAATAQGLAGAWFTDQRHRPESLDFKNVPHAWPQQDGHPTLQQAARQLAEFFAGQRQDFELAYDISGGTLFQQSVWRALLKIKHGAISSYGKIASEIKKHIPDFSISYKSLLNYSITTFFEFKIVPSYLRTTKL